MMEKLNFTDAELNLIALALQKVDPTEIIAEAQTAKRKIQEYAQAKEGEPGKMGEKQALST
jgi:predicted DNA-binding transcriptional regulator YafY